MSNDYQDAGHRPHARHTGETPRNEIKEAPYHLSVTLDTWGPVDNLFPAMYDALQANWGDEPSRMVEADDSDAPVELWPQTLFDMQRKTGWTSLSKNQRAYVESCFARRTLQQVLERITFSFLVDGCTRACTHQLVRSRIGSAMMQHGGRDNDWRHRPWVMPETIRRACLESENSLDARRYVDGNLKSPITSFAPINDLLERYDNEDADPLTLRTMIEWYLRTGRDLYAALVDAGIPWEDARRLLWMGTATYIHIDYNYIAFRDMQANRLEHVMDWEINCVAQLMQREVRMKCPPIFSKYLGSASDLAGQAKFAGLQSWPPDGKYPNPYERCSLCGHAFANHKPDPDMVFAGREKETGHIYECEVCVRNGTPKSPEGFKVNPLHTYDPVDSLPREHRPEQNPFWILHPDSMNGGPIKWIPTNGTYPHEVFTKHLLGEG